MMCTELKVAVSTRGNVKVALNLVPLEAAEYAAGVEGLPAADFWRAQELAATLTHVTEDVRHVLVFFFCALAAFVWVVQLVPVVATALGWFEVLVLPSGRLVSPKLPICVMFCQEVSSHDTVHGRVLDVDMEVSTGHGDDDVEVELELMANTALDGEVVCFGATEIGSYFSDSKEGTEYYEGESPLPASRSGRCVRRFRFGWSLSVPVQATA